MLNRVVLAAAFTLAAAGGAAAPPAASTSTPMELQTRPATTTYMGDTGLWMVPTGEILPAGKFSISAYRVNFDDNQGFTDVSDWPVTVGVGVGDRAEIFGALTVVNRIDRDIRPLFVPSIAQAGGYMPEYPLVHEGWTGNNIGDLWIGAKINLTSEWRQQPAAFAIRPMIKLPTGKQSAGASTGKADFAFDAVVSKEINQRAEVAGDAGVLLGRIAGQ